VEAAPTLQLHERRGTSWSAWQQRHPPRRQDFEVVVGGTCTRLGRIQFPGPAVESTRSKHNWRRRGIGLVPSRRVVHPTPGSSCCCDRVVLVQGGRVVHRHELTDSLSPHSPSTCAHCSSGAHVQVNRGAATCEKLVASLAGSLGGQRHLQLVMQPIFQAQVLHGECPKKRQGTAFVGHTLVGLQGRAGADERGPDRQARGESRPQRNTPWQHPHGTFTRTLG
jgi:hypothetical protein